MITEMISQFSLAYATLTTEHIPKYTYKTT